jgi:RNA polymerase sigma-70 factor (ECF subfamily)
MPLNRSHATSIPLDAGPRGCPSPGRLQEGARTERMDGTDWATTAALHERYLEDVFRYVVRRVSAIEEAEDITAEVFAAAAAGLAGFRGQCPPRLWLLGIARRKIAAALRRRATRRETLASELAPEAPDAEALWEAFAAAEEPEALLIRAEAKHVLGELVAQLSADQREALLLQFVEQLSVAEIAVVMGRSPASVKSLLQRARETVYHRGRAYFLPDDEGGQR